MTEKNKEVSYGIYGGKGLDDLVHFPKGMWFLIDEVDWREFQKEGLWEAEHEYLRGRLLQVPFEYMT